MAENADHWDFGRGPVGLRSEFCHHSNPVFRGRSGPAKDPKMLLNDNFAGKPEGIHLIRDPHAWGEGE
jgi:hypothetical protein